MTPRSTRSTGGAGMSGRGGRSSRELTPAERPARVPHVAAAIALDFSQVRLDLATREEAFAVRLDPAVLVDVQAAVVLGVLEPCLTQDQVGRPAPMTPEPPCLTHCDRYRRPVVCWRRRAPVRGTDEAALTGTP